MSVPYSITLSLYGFLLISLNLHFVIKAYYGRTLGRYVYVKESFMESFWKFFLDVFVEITSNEASENNFLKERQKYDLLQDKTNPAIIEMYITRF